MAKRRNKKVYIPMWECEEGVVGCPLKDTIFSDQNPNIEICKRCPHNIAKIEILKYQPWMEKHMPPLGESIYFSEKGAKEYIEKTDSINKRGGALLNV